MWAAYRRIPPRKRIVFGVFGMLFAVSGMKFYEDDGFFPSFMRPSTNDEASSSPSATATTQASQDSKTES
ncbi:hypothetical protein PTSG_11586 [Salpingoeca rosetta]|uniref:Uncharacterized protein n=1 Tax=Salpingoeca rosetta (strain ATCC 50818 / BSB-021) TaxID=946362 RepID=F2TWH4_SALR5|nr:uncharacterized protein PTSG_11586 [Salpingoeca rosetta]EGD72420.1 hypothetical protein PTSG_11586 [Salpingoeca rosetta]|eukprot:XP_004998989.1 hypothetical protein PTSG_11586 [Salpingoeca rosetta]